MATLEHSEDKMSHPSEKKPGFGAPSVPDTGWFDSDNRQGDPGNPNDGSDPDHVVGKLHTPGTQAKHGGETPRSK